MHRGSWSAAAVAALVLLVGAAPAGATAAASGGTATPTRAIIGFAGELPAEIAGVDVVRISPQGRWIAVSAPSFAAIEAAAAALPGVAYAEADVTLAASVTPNDTRYGEQYGPAMMGAPAAWDAAGFGSSAVTVAVLDTGLRRTHEDLTPGSRFLQGHDYVSDDTDPNDRCGHGTHVTGTVAATTGNARGVAGMSQASVLPYKVLDPVGGLINVTCTGSTSDIAQAIIDATDAGADVISMSLGGGGSTTLQNAVRYAWNRGVLVVAASGNDGGNNSVDYPAAYAEVIAVGALDASGARASYSDGGSQLDVMAPGSNVLSTYNSSNTSYSSLSGTSMATPHVAGALALALSCAPAGTTATAVRAALESTTEDRGAAGYDTAYGHGLVRADRMVAALCDGEPVPGNADPVASFTSSTSGLAVSVDGSGSSDPDGDPLSYAWTFGDGATASGVTATHTYAAGGSYTVTLTVTDGRGGSDTASAQVTVAGGGDPDPSTPTLTSGETRSVTLSGSGDEEFFKIAVPSGASTLTVTIDGPACGLLGCSFDADLYTRHGARPSDSAYDCRPFASGSDETCTHTAPPAGFTYIRVDSYSGSGTVALTATVS